METISVRFHPVTFDQNAIYHKYVSYEDANGNSYQLHGGGVPGYAGSPLDELAGAAIGNSTFGKLKVTVVEKPSNPKDPSEVIARGENLAGKFYELLQNAYLLDRLDTDYDPFDNNSNKLIDTALAMSGLPLPKLDDEYWSPGSLDDDTTIHGFSQGTTRDHRDNPNGPNAPQIGGVDPARLAEAIRIRATSADPSFIKSGRSELDNPYGPNGTPQIGGVDPNKLAAAVLRAIVNSPDFKPTLAPDPFNPPNPADIELRTGKPYQPSDVSPPNPKTGGWSNGGKTEPRDGSTNGAPGTGANNWGSGHGQTEPRDGSVAKTGNWTARPDIKPASNYATEAAVKGKGGQPGFDSTHPNVKTSNPSKAVRSDPRDEQREEQHVARSEKSRHDGSNSWNKPGGTQQRDPKPVLLDLDNNGIAITELTRSNTFLDTADDGLLHRTAWAGAGDGVLFYDVGDDGKISETREYVFTEWNPAAPGDLEAIASVFDTNGDGVLSGAELAGFKVMVTKADGTTEAKTLAELGITSITLKPDATHIELRDGSVVTGQAAFTKADGSTGIVANTTLSAEAQGHTVTQGVSTGADGSKTTETKAYDAGGTLAYAIVSTSSADGSLVNTSYDDNGDGTVDRLQTISTQMVSGVKTEMEVNSIGADAADAVLASRQQTVTSQSGEVIRSSSEAVSRKMDFGGTVVTFRWRRKFGFAVGQQASHCHAA